MNIYQQNFISIQSKKSSHCKLFSYRLARAAPSCLGHCKSAKSYGIAHYQEAFWEAKTKMADTLRAAFTSVTETVFPTSRSIRNNPRRHMISTGLRIVSYQLQAYNLCISLRTNGLAKKNQYSVTFYLAFTFPGNEIVSNLPLQMSLYFNVYFSPFWYATCIVMLVAKVLITFIFNPFLLLFVTNEVFHNF